jgi:pimeloyl-ACP methyl ester carboxylesterase
MQRVGVGVDVDGGRVAVWTREGDGPCLLLLHGGPGLSDYLEDLADEFGEGWNLAGYQQRGLAPSTQAGPFTVARHVADARAVLEALGWERAYAVGHSWGGHLALHLGLAIPTRIAGVLAVDPLGGVGDGGFERFGAELAARTPAADRERAEALDQRAMRGEGSEEDMRESLALFWPAYHARRDAPPPMPPLRISIPCYAETLESIQAELPALEARLPDLGLPVGFIAGAKSPIPVQDASGATAARIPGAWLEVIDETGHFPWLERPGCVAAAARRLVDQGPAPAQSV